MSNTSPDVDAALLAAAQLLPSHFTGGDTLTLEALDAIQATTMSLPGGAIAVESVLKGAGTVGPVVLIVTGLVDHANGEVFSRDEARTLWTAALTEALTALQGDLGDFTIGQIHMTDAFDALDNSDEATVVGVFDGQTLAGMLLAQPAVATGEGAAAQLAAEVAAAQEAEEDASGSDENESDDNESDRNAESAGSANSSETAAGSASGTAEGPAEAPLGDAGTGATTAGGAGATGVPGAAEAMAAGPGISGLAAAYGVSPGAGSYVPSAAQQAAMAADAQAYAAAQAQLQGAMTPQHFQPLTGGTTYPIDPRRIDLLRDVIMGVSVELGRTRLTVQEILALIPGSIVELDRAAGAPVDVLVNGTLIAHGEVVVVDEEFAVRISDVVSPDSEGRVTA